VMDTSAVSGPTQLRRRSCKNAGKDSCFMSPSVRMQPHSWIAQTDL
jgi:hypothetical protein